MVVFPSDITQKLLPSEKIQFYITAPLMSCYFTNRRIMYKANSVAKMANSNNFSLFAAGLSMAMGRQDYEDIPYNRVESVTIEGSGLVPTLRICLIGGRVLQLAYRSYASAIQTQQFIINKIL